MDINLTLTLDEINGLLTLLGKLPTETNIWPLASKMRAQAEQQLPKEPQAPADNSGAGLTD